VDLCLVTTSLDLDLNLRRLERFTALARAGGVEVLIVCTKGDLARDPLAEAAAVSAATGAESIVLSARDGWGVNGLRARLAAGRTHALVGMSGVGKSTLVNLLLGEERQRTLAVRERDARGRHATTHRELFVLEGGALLIDTPGLRLPRMASTEGVADAFADVEIGNMWMARTGVQTGIKTEPGKIDSPLKWYFDEYARVNKSTKWVDLTAQQVRLLMKPGVWETYVATVNQGLPNKVIGPDEALGKLEEARLRGK
jgi:ethanolamine utilization protein EutP (predicted NTPase)